MPQIRNGKTYYLQNTNTFEEQRDEMQPIYDLNATYKDTDFNPVNEYRAGAALEDIIARIKRTPVFNPNTGPVVNGVAQGTNFSVNPGTGTGFTAGGVNYGSTDINSIKQENPAFTTPTPSTSTTSPSTGTGSSGVSGAPPPNITQNLGPGSKGEQVKTLQNWLISQGFDISAGATGYYGDQTKAAVAAWQQKAGFDTGGNPGYFGPRSIAYLAQTQTSDTGGGTGTGGTGTGAGGTTGTDGSGAGAGGSTLDQSSVDGLKFLFGWTDEQVRDYAQSNPSEAKHWAMTGEYLKKQSDANGASTEATAQAIQDAYVRASQDPLIAGKYADIQSVDKANFANNLASLQSSADVTANTQKMQFEQDYKNLAENAAASGQAYSGFREQAKGKLGQQQSGVITSTRQGFKDNLTNLVTNLQAKYGSDQFSSLFPNLALNYNNPMNGASESINPSLIPGNLMGTLPIQKAADVTNRQQQIVQGLAPSTKTNG